MFGIIQKYFLYDIIYEYYTFIQLSFTHKSLLFLSFFSHFFCMDVQGMFFYHVESKIIRQPIYLYWGGIHSNGSGASGSGPSSPIVGGALISLKSSSGSPSKLSVKTKTPRFLLGSKSLRTGR
jgi:hypothetical protein